MIFAMLTAVPSLRCLVLRQLSLLMRLQVVLDDRASALFFASKAWPAKSAGSPVLGGRDGPGKMAFVRRPELASRLAKALLPPLESALPAGMKVSFDERGAMVVLVSMPSGGTASSVSFPFGSLRLPLPVRLTMATCARQVLLDLRPFAKKVRSPWPDEYLT